MALYTLNVSYFYLATSLEEELKAFSH